MTAQPPRQVRLAVAALLGLALMTGTVMAAEPQTPGEAARRAGGAVAADQASVQAAYDAFESGGYSALARHLPKLEAIIAGMPQPYAQWEVANGVVTVHANSLGQFMMLSELAKSTLASKGQIARTSVWVPEPYSLAALMLGSYYNEKGDFRRAISALQAGLIAQPQNAMMIGEQGVGYVGLHDWAKALATYDRGLALADVEDNDRARLYRGRGFALIELHRLDEAEAAFNTSLQLEPDHGGAQAELRYIAGLRAGQAPTQTEIFTGDQAKNRR